MILASSIGGYRTYRLLGPIAGVFTPRRKPFQLLR